VIAGFRREIAENCAVLSCTFDLSLLILNDSLFDLYKKSINFREFILVK
jgi:hypothetical protein